MGVIEGYEQQLDLARAFADAARVLQQSAGFSETLKRIVDLAVATVPGCEHAALSLPAAGDPASNVRVGTVSNSTDPPTRYLRKMLLSSPKIHTPPLGRGQSALKV